MVTQAAATAKAPEIIYPETDGMPLPDGELEAPLYIRIVGTLRVPFGADAETRVNGDTFIYFIEGGRCRPVSPDCYVAERVCRLKPTWSIVRNNVYLIWEVGKAPDFVMEIGSESTASADLDGTALTCTPSWKWRSTGDTTPPRGRVLADALPARREPGAPDEYRPATAGL